MVKVVLEFPHRGTHKEAPTACTNLISSFKHFIKPLFHFVRFWPLVMILDVWTSIFKMFAWYPLIMLTSKGWSEWSLGCFPRLKILKLIVMFTKVNFINTLRQLIKVFDVAKKGQPRITGICPFGFSLPVQFQGQQNRLGIWIIQPWSARLLPRPSEFLPIY